VDDAAAAVLGVPLYGLYRNGNAVQIRLVWYLSFIIINLINY
jgi:hypothetical protein